MTDNQDPISSEAGNAYDDTVSSADHRREAEKLFLPEKYLLASLQKL